MPSPAAAADLDAAPMSSATPGVRRIRRVVTTTRSTVGTPLHSSSSSDVIAKFRENMAEKTDYTYSKTGTYNVGYLQNHVVTPNLSRPYLRERNTVYVSTPGELSERRPVDFNTRSRLMKSGAGLFSTALECSEASAATAAAAAATANATEVQLDGRGGHSSRSTTYHLYSTSSSRVERRDADDGLTSSVAGLQRQLHFADDEHADVDGVRRLEFSDYTDEDEEENEENVNISRRMPARTRRATSTSKSRSPQRKARARRSVAGGVDGYAGRVGGGGGASVAGSSATLSTVTDVSKSVSMYGLDVTESEAYTDATYSLTHHRAQSTPITASSGDSSTLDARGGTAIATAVADAASGAYRLLAVAGQTILKWWWTVQETVIQTIVSRSSRCSTWLAEATRRRSGSTMATDSATRSGRRGCAYCCLCLWLLLLLLPLVATMLVCGLHATGFADVPMCSRLSGIYYVDKDGVSYTSVLGERTRQIVVNLVNMGRSSSTAGADQQLSGAVDSRIIAEMEARIDRQRRQLDGSVNERLSVQLQRISEMESEVDLLRKEQGLAKSLQGEFDSLRHEVLRDLSRLGTEISRVRDAAIAENPDTQHDIVSLNLQLEQLKTSLDEVKKAHQMRMPLEVELSQAKNEIGKLKARLEALEATSGSTAEAVAAVRAPCAGADGCACRKDLAELEKSIVHRVDAVDRRLVSTVTDTVARAAHGGTERTNVYISSPNGTGISEEIVRDLVKQELSIYSADKTGLPDYALESIGGKIVSTRCSESYYDRAARITFLGVPLWRTVNQPNVVIQPSMVPGQCWAFRGSEGYLVVRLALTVKPTSFVIEHIPRSQSPTGSIDSAPKDFSVYGLMTETSNDLTKIGDWRYDSEGPSLQFFPVSDLNVKPYPIVELRIRSNWGNPEYTCLYRFRVHGVPVMP